MTDELFNIKLSVKVNLLEADELGLIVLLLITVSALIKPEPLNVPLLISGSWSVPSSETINSVPSVVLSVPLFIQGEKAG